MKIGDIALCQNNRRGLITRIVPIGQTAESATHSVAYGIHLSQTDFGKPWQSNGPRILGNIFDYMNVIPDYK